MQFFKKAAVAAENERGLIVRVKKGVKEREFLERTTVEKDIKELEKVGKKV